MHIMKKIFDYYYISQQSSAEPDELLEIENENHNLNVHNLWSTYYILHPIHFQSYFHVS